MLRFSKYGVIRRHTFVSGYLFPGFAISEARGLCRAGLDIGKTNPTSCVA